MAGERKALAVKAAATGMTYGCLESNIIRAPHCHLLLRSFINSHSDFASLEQLLMRFPSLPTFIRTLYAFSNTTIRAAPSPLHPAVRPSALRASMPTIPFLGALFSSAPTRNMSHPVQKNDQEWQAVLSPGKSTPSPLLEIRWIRS